VLAESNSAKTNHHTEKLDPLLGILMENRRLRNVELKVVNHAFLAIQISINSYGKRLLVQFEPQQTVGYHWLSNLMQKILKTFSQSALQYNFCQDI
tara:strand:- start:458 stop:745 length:288 start_codon:yes stop_codon:yes gene_type:complete